MTANSICFLSIVEIQELGKVRAFPTARLHFTHRAFLNTLL